MSIADNIDRVKEQITLACTRAGRDVRDVTLMAVSKTHTVAAMAEAYAGGVRVFGENKVQEFEAKAQDVRRQMPLARVALIGHLQSNKAARAAELFDAVESVDSVKIAERLNSAAAAAGRVLPVHIEVKLADEESKAGVRPESVGALLDAICDLPAIAVRGLMAVPPYCEDAERVRPYFAQLRQLRDALQREHAGVVELSMGMSNDFAVAIEEGSTAVRVGTAIFGAREYV
jgi:hypothetical protein